MSSYAVLWQDSTREPIWGRLNLGPQGLVMQGGYSFREIVVEVPYEEIVRVERDSLEEAGRCRAIRLTTHTDSMLIASFGGMMLFNEILNAVQDALPA